MQTGLKKFLTLFNAHLILYLCNKNIELCMILA